MIIMTFILLIFFIYCTKIIDFKNNSFGQASMSLSANCIYDFETALFDYNWNYVVCPSSESKEELTFCIILMLLQIIKPYSIYIFWKKSLYLEKTKTLLIVLLQYKNNLSVVNILKETN